MRKTKVLFVTLVAGALTSLGGCNFSLDGETTWEYEADTLEGAYELYQGFFKDTFAHTNMTVTSPTGSSAFTESVLGTSDHFLYLDGSTETWAFIDKDGNKMGAVRYQSGEGSEKSTSEYKVTGEEYYKTYYKSYKIYVSFLETLYNAAQGDLDSEEKESLKRTSVSAVEKGKGTFSVGSEEATSESVFECNVTIKDEEGKENNKVSMKAEAKNGLVSKVTRNSWVLVIDEEGNKTERSSSITLNFTYDDVEKIEIPDVSDWYDASDTNE